MSASPVASITRLARIASRPALLSVITPRISPPSMIGATPSRCSIGVTPASCHQHVGDVLERLGVERVAQRLRLRHAPRPSPSRAASNSMPMPSQSTVSRAGTRPKPSTPTWVMLPPKQPLRSSRVVSTPARAEASAAASPPGPLPPPARRSHARQGSGGPVPRSIGSRRGGLRQRTNLQTGQVPTDVTSATV